MRLVAIVVVTLAAAACARTLDTRGLEDQIVALLEERGGPAVTDVTCPDDVEVAAGTAFRCAATDEDGATWELQVRQTDDDGTVSLEIVGAGG